jgi:glycerol transport system ATP-binding protein
MMSSHTAILHNGKIIQYGKTDEVYRKPNHVKAGEYFSDPPMNFLPCSVTDGEAVIAPDFRIPLQAMGVDLVPGRYTLGIRAHHIAVNGSAERSGITVIAMVELAERVGSDTTIRLSHQDLEFVALTQDFKHFELDQRITVSFDPRQIHVFQADSGQVVSTAAEVR